MKRINLVFLGEKQSGKTALLNRFLKDTSDDSLKIEVDSVHKILTVHNPSQLQIHLIDTSGKERCRTTISSYIQNSTVFIIVYDITDPDSFESTRRWVDIVHSEHGNNSIIVLVGNKTELEDKRMVSTKDGEKMAKELNTMFIETSAVSGPYVKILFRCILEAVTKLGVTLPEHFHEKVSKHGHEICNIV